MAKKNPWSYQIDYDKEIAADEVEVAYLSDARTIKIAALFEEWIEANPSTDYWDLNDLLWFVPESADLLGFTGDDVRTLFAHGDHSPEVEARFGEAQRGDYQRGNALWSKPSLDPREDWASWRALRESGPRGRAALLKKAKASLSRHRRNKAKYGG